jgi:tRNA(fMet)-specific endonuclease VapC
MRVALDTNSYSNLLLGLGSFEAQDLVENADQVFLPLIVLAELHSGFRIGKKRRENEELLNVFLSKPGVEILYPDYSTANHYADLSLQLRVHGTPIPTNDLWIASLVLQHDLFLITNDSHFDHCQGIQIKKLS